MTFACSFSAKPFTGCEAALVDRLAFEIVGTNVAPEAWLNSEGDVVADTPAVSCDHEVAQTIVVASKQIAFRLRRKKSNDMKQAGMVRVGEQRELSRL